MPPRNVRTTRRCRNSGTAMFIFLRIFRLQTHMESRHHSTLSGKFHGTGRIHPPDSAGIPYQAALLPRALQAFDGGAFSPSFQKSCPKGGKGRPRSLRKSFSASALPCSPAVRRTGVWNGSAGRAVFPRVSFLPITNVSLRTAPRRSFCRPDGEGENPSQ